MHHNSNRKILVYAFGERQHSHGIAADDELFDDNVLSMYYISILLHCPIERTIILNYN
jgi:hypothetical protein